jgi:ribose/xylose/arabinose/galactoside ABC-type transport system permease subunit
VLYALVGLSSGFHSFGRSIYAIGATRGRRAAGIRVDRVLIAAYVIAGLLASVAG